ncbi:MAG TPA: dihydrofolate reductase family protein [Pyrinomonadaceae bacterium]|nr:dihydrofolate reductase family protein [Pyrinomonadaceae bacterium]
MGKLKLQMQTSIDNFIAGPNGEMDWMVWNWDEELKNYVSELTKPIEKIILGRKLAEGFIGAWASRVKDPEKTDEFAHKMNDTKKIVFSRSLNKIEGNNTTINNGDLVEEINKLKNEVGEIIAYGGGEFVTSLIKNNLIDEYHLFVNPIALGNGLTIFGGLNEKLNLELVKAKAFECGIVALHYQPKT